MYKINFKVFVAYSLENIKAIVDTEVLEKEKAKCF